MNHRQKFMMWKENVTEAYTRNELESIETNDHEIKERFYTDLKFGTGGIRGIMGAGPNRINIYTIRKATQGLAHFIHSAHAKKEPSVAIAYDSRRFSDVFAKEAALVLAANNIRAYLFESLRPTPELSFAVRKLNCDAGIVLTASHNPPEYNGYKVYGEDGGQITLETAQFITNEILKLNLFEDIRTMTEEEALKQGLLVYIGREIDQDYLKQVVSLSVNPDSLTSNNGFKVVYTPLHGTGLKPVIGALDLVGFKSVHIVESQRKPNGNFPTVKSPNPEEREALQEGITLAAEIGADLVLGTDPDTDRVGVAVKEREGTYRLLTGNQIGALLTHYLVSNKKDICSKDAVIKTIVTSELGAGIAEAHGATVFNTLTGFKYIGEMIGEFEKNGQKDFLFGYEESYGYLAGTFVRDKDAVISTVLIIEMGAYYHSQGLTLTDVLRSIYEEFGFYTDALKSYTFEGIKGKEKIASIMEDFQNTDELLRRFPNIKTIENFNTGTRLNIDTSEIEQIDLPKEKVVKLYFNDNAWFAVRPSGTEPKLKVYFSTVAGTGSESEKRMHELKELVASFIEN